MHERMLLTELGAVGDGRTDCTRCFSEGFSQTKHLVVPAGIYYVGPFSIPSNTILELEKNARLLFSDDVSRYEPVLSRWEGVDCYCMHPLLFIADVENVAIIGSGVLDGNGKAWWESIIERRHTQNEPLLPIERRLAALNPEYRTQPGGGGGRQCQFLRPPLVQILRSRNVRIEGVTLCNSPFWTLHTVLSQDVIIDGITERNPADSPNTDGMDIESSLRVTIRHCSVDVGDDGICLKSGSGKEGVDAGVPTTDVTVEGCVVKNAHGGFVIGSETAAGIRNVHVTRCIFDGTDRGIRIKTRRGRGGNISGIAVEDVVMHRTICPFVINMYYHWGIDDGKVFSLDPQPVDETTPEIRDIQIKRCTADGCRASAGFLVGLPESPIRNVVMENCSFLVEEQKEPDLEPAMAKGIPHTDFRGIRIMNADVSFCDVIINVSPAWERC